MPDKSMRRVVCAVGLLNFAYFFIEFVVARRIGSVSLFADSVDFLEDASVNFLIAIALGWSAIHRGRVGATLALILLIPGMATIITAWQKFQSPVAPAVSPLTLTALGALVINLSCAFLLASFRTQKGSLTKAAFLSARNDALANVAIIVTGLITLWFRSGWPDLLLGLGIAALNADAAREVWNTSKEERLTPEA